MIPLLPAAHTCPFAWETSPKSATTDGLVSLTQRRTPLSCGSLAETYTENVKLVAEPVRVHCQILVAVLCPGARFP
jgi:hypothetical protein